MGATPIYGLPFLDDNDPPDIPLDGEQSMSSVEDELARIDAVLALRLSAMSTYTPAIQATSGSPTLGNGTWSSARYKHDGRFVDVDLELTLGSTTNLGTAGTAITVPVAPHASAAVLCGFGAIIDASPAARRIVVCFLDIANSRFNLMTYDGVFVSQTTPWTFAVSDVVRAKVRYEAATSNP